MAEIGLIASVVQVAGAGLKLSHTLYQYVDGVATADRRIKDIATEIRLTSFVIEELGNVFKSDETKTLISKGALKTADETMKECSDVFAEIDATLKKSKKNTFGRLMLPFRDTKIELLRSHIDKLKDTLTLLLGVLSVAHHVATKKLDRKAEAEAKAQIQELIELKKKSAKKYEESLKNFSISDGSSQTLLDDADAENVDATVQIKAANDEPAAPLSVMAIASSINPQTLETCVQHVRSLLDSIETLQQALTNAVDGSDHSTHHQSLIDSYFRARGHLDGVIFRGSPQQDIVTDAQPGAELTKKSSLSSGSASGPRHSSSRLNVSSDSAPQQGLQYEHRRTSSETYSDVSSAHATPYLSSLTTELHSNPVVSDGRHRRDSSSSSSSGTDPSGPSRILMPSGTENEIKLRVDGTAPLSLQLSGDIEGRTMQLVPAESGMTDMVIGGDGSRSSRTIYRSERDSATSKSRSVIADHKRREAEDVSERSSRNPRLRRSKRIVDYPSETASQRSDPNPYFSPTSAQSPAVVQTARTRRQASVAHAQPQSLAGDSSTAAPSRRPSVNHPTPRGPPSRSTQAKRNSHRKSIPDNDSGYDQRASYDHGSDRTVGGQFDAERQGEKRYCNAIIRGGYMSSPPNNDDDNEGKEDEGDDVWAVVDPQENVDLMSKAKQDAGSRKAGLVAEEHMNATPGRDEPYADAINKSKRVKSIVKNASSDYTGKDAPALLPDIASQKHQAQVEDYPSDEDGGQVMADRLSRRSSPTAQANVRFKCSKDFSFGSSEREVSSHSNSVILDVSTLPDQPQIHSGSGYIRPQRFAASSRAVPHSPEWHQSAGRQPPPHRQTQSDIHQASIIAKSSTNWRDPSHNTVTRRPRDTRPSTGGKGEKSASKPAVAKPDSTHASPSATIDRQQNQRARPAQPPYASASMREHPQQQQNSNQVPSRGQGLLSTRLQLNHQQNFYQTPQQYGLPLAHEAALARAFTAGAAGYQEPQKTGAKMKLDGHAAPWYPPAASGSFSSNMPTQVPMDPRIVQPRRMSTQTSSPATQLPQPVMSYVESRPSMPPHISQQPQPHQQSLELVAGAQFVVADQANYSGDVAEDEWKKEEARPRQQERSEAARGKVPTRPLRPTRLGEQAQEEDEQHGQETKQDEEKSKLVGELEKYEGRTADVVDQVPWSDGSFADIETECLKGGTTGSGSISILPNSNALSAAAYSYNFFAPRAASAYASNNYPLSNYPSFGFSMSTGGRPADPSSSAGMLPPTRSPGLGNPVSPPMGVSVRDNYTTATPSLHRHSHALSPRCSGISDNFDEVDKLLKEWTTVF